MEIQSEQHNFRRQPTCNDCESYVFADMWDANGDYFRSHICIKLKLSFGNAGTDKDNIAYEQSPYYTDSSVCDKWACDG